MRSRRPGCNAGRRRAALAAVAEGARDVLTPFAAFHRAAADAPDSCAAAWEAGLRGLGAARDAGEVAAALDAMERGLEAARAERAGALRSRLRWRAAGMAATTAWCLSAIAAAVMLALAGHDMAAMAAALCMPLPALGSLLAP